MVDVIVIGGSYAGMSAALQLGRARRRVLVIDAGERRNRFAAHAHGLLGADGTPPEVLAARGRAEVLAYPTVSWLEGRVTEARRDGDHFVVRVGAEAHRSRRLVLATGVRDELPSVPGLVERWGRTVFHCPYCHGYELGRGRLGVLAAGPISAHFAELVTEWAGPGQATLFVNGAFELDHPQQAALAAREVRVVHERVVAVDGEAPTIGVRLAAGERIELEGLFVAPRAVLHGDFAAQLGCEVEEGPMGQLYRTDATKATTVPGVFACGDVARPMPALSFAIADGQMAGVAAHRSLVFGERGLA